MQDLDKCTSCDSFINAHLATLLITLVFKKRISYTLQYYNAWIIYQAHLILNNYGGGNIHRGFDLENIS